MAVLRTEQAVGAQQPDSASRRYGNSEREREKRGRRVVGMGGESGEDVGGVRQGDVGWRGVGGRILRTA